MKILDLPFNAGLGNLTENLLNFCLIEIALGKIISFLIAIKLHK